MTGRLLGAHRSFFLVLAVVAAVRPTMADTATPSAAADAAAPTPAPLPVASPAHPPANGGTTALVVDDTGAQTLLSLPVQTSKGEDLGRVVDVVVDRNGALLAAVVDFGGFLGVGSRKIAVDWRILHFAKADHMGKLIADLPLDQLRNAPAFKPGESIVIMGAPAAPVASHTSPPASPTPDGPKP
jgi:PRC-barrel domain